MYGFKSIDEFTFNDCIKSIELYKKKGLPVDTEIQERYDYLLSIYKKQEKHDFSALKTIEDLERFIKKYTEFMTVTKYESLYLTEVKKNLIQLKRKRETKENIKIVCMIIFGLLCYLLQILLK